MARTREEILSEITGLSIDYMFNIKKDIWTITPPVIIEAMEAYHQERLREELLKFVLAYDDVMEISDANKWIDEYLNSRKDENSRRND